MIQEQTLSKIILDKDPSIITLNNLSDEYFSDYKAEYNFIKKHIELYGNVPDAETFLDTFPDFELLQVGESASYLLQTLTEDRTRRVLVENFNEMRPLLMNNDMDAAISTFKKAVDKVDEIKTMSAIDLLHDTSRFDSYEDKINNKDKYFISTGFTELDDITGGWDVNEDLVTIVARNGLGKSWLLLKCAAAAAAQGKRVGIYSGEMSEDSVGYRIDSILGHISNGSLLHGGASVKNQYKNFLESLKEMPGSLYVITPKMINGPATVSALRAFIEKYKLDILFVDQHSLLEDDKHAKNPVEKAANISKDLKLLQTTKRIPVICVSQQNREKLEDGKSFDTTQVAQSDRIAQDSSVIIFIERKDDLMKLHLVKSRNTGAGAVLSYKVDLNLGYWTYVPEGTEESGSQMVDSNAVAYAADDVF